jgi:hypothetical protein
MVSSSSASSTFAIVAIFLFRLRHAEPSDNRRAAVGCTLLLPRGPFQQTSREITFPGLAKSAAWNPSG